MFRFMVPSGLLSQVADIYVECFSGPPRFEPWTSETAQIELLKYLQAGADFLLAIEGEDVLAFAVGLPLAKSPICEELVEQGADRNSYYFVALGTRVRARRNGLGAMLHARREQEGRKHGFNIMTVRVREDNHENRRLLERAGFVEVGRYVGVIAGSSAQRLVMAKDCSKVTLGSPE